MINNEIYNIFLSFFTAFAITFLAIPVIIKVAKEKHLFDFPDERKVHSSKIPTLGGIGIFLGFLFAMTFWTRFIECWHLQYLTASLIIISFLGIKDDLIGLSAFKKAVGQVFAALILVIWGDLRIESFYNIFGVQELPYMISVLFTTFTIIVIINAYNLIDGIDGLAASLGLVASVTFGVLFFMTGKNYQQSILAFSLAGGLLGFLKFNITPAKIFMGDTGSMVVGFIVAFLALEFIEIKDFAGNSWLAVGAAPLISMSLIFVPLYDLARVFGIRLWNKRSPFRADQNHLHHMLLKLGFSHMYSTFIMTLFASLLILLALMFERLGNYWIGAILLSTCLLFTYILWGLVKKRGAKQINGK
jgi:UDP-N-acetylmuramyl pentapeptide phosphotransferase/UDP-N-acetylglucosamine-1-phosphate transferase